MTKTKSKVRFAVQFMINKCMSCNYFTTHICKHGDRTKACFVQALCTFFAFPGHGQTHRHSHRCLSMASGRRYDCVCVRTVVIVLLYVRSHNVGRRPYSSTCGCGTGARNVLLRASDSRHGDVPEHVNPKLNPNHSHWHCHWSNSRVTSPIAIFSRTASATWPVEV